MDRESKKSSIGQELLSDHERLDALFDRLLQDVRRGDWAVCQATWSQFEKELLAHLELEEAELLPRYERDNPYEASALRQEHATIRSLLAEMGVRLELHAEREQSVARFVEALRSHAAREDKVFYQWTKGLSPELTKTLGDRLSHAEPPPR